MEDERSEGMPENDYLTPIVSPLGMQHCVLRLCSLFNSLNLVRAYSGPGTVLGLGWKTHPCYQQLISSGGDQCAEKQSEYSVMVLGWRCRMRSWGDYPDRPLPEWPPPSRKDRQEMLSGGPETSAET